MPQAGTWDKAVYTLARVRDPYDRSTSAHTLAPLRLSHQRTRSPITVSTSARACPSVEDGKCCHKLLRLGLMKRNREVPLSVSADFLWALQLPSGASSSIQGFGPTTAAKRQADFQTVTRNTKILK